MGARNLEVAVVPTPNRSRGCATIKGRRVVMALAPPSKFSKTKLARLFEHEVLHTDGLEHDDMTEEERYSTRTRRPYWAEVPIHYRHKGDPILP